MHQPQLFIQCNAASKHDAKLAIEKYLPLLNIRDDGAETFLEFGCGPGDITKHILLPALPRSFKKFISSDISEAMIEYASLECAHANIEYKILDIATQESIEHFGRFNHIFGFFVLHWVQNVRQALKNMHELLNPGGNILMTQLAPCPIFMMYEQLLKKGLWTEYMYDYKKYVTPYFSSEDPKNEFRALLVEQGFFINLLEIYSKSYEYPDLDHFKSLLQAINPFLERIPKTLHEAYIEDLVNAAKELHVITNVENSPKIQLNYKVIEAVVTRLSFC